MPTCERTAGTPSFGGMSIRSAKVAEDAKPIVGEVLKWFKVVAFAVSTTITVLKAIHEMMPDEKTADEADGDTHS